MVAKHKTPKIFTLKLQSPSSFWMDETMAMDKTMGKSMGHGSRAFSS